MKVGLCLNIFFDIVFESGIKLNCKKVKEKFDIVKKINNIRFKGKYWCDYRLISK